MPLDLSQLDVKITPEWLQKFQAKNGSDEGEILAISPEFLDMASNQNVEHIRKTPMEGKELLAMIMQKP